MHGHEEDPQELQHAIEQGFEHRDLPTSTIGKAVLGLFIFFFVSIGLTIGYLRFVDSVGHQLDTRDRQTAEVRRALPPGPLVQSNVTTKKDMVDLRAQEVKKTERFEKLTTKPGYVQIPVDVAIEKIAKEGLPQ